MPKKWHRLTILQGRRYETQKMAFLASVFCMFVSSLFAGSADSDDRVYISKDIIELTDDGMYVIAEDQLVPIGTIYHDEQGLVTAHKNLDKSGQIYIKCVDLLHED